MKNYLSTLINNKHISITDKVLVVCGSIEDYDRLKILKFKNFLVTSAYLAIPGVRKYKMADAQNLPFKDKSFDVVLVNLGLHHCASPHQALCEMYRVAKKTVIVHEAQDTFITRTLVKLGFMLDYEIAEYYNGKKYDSNASIINYVYRWRKDEVTKTINTYDPFMKHKIIFHSNFTFYSSFLDEGGFWHDKLITIIFGKRLTNSIIEILVKVVNNILGSQGNDLFFVIQKSRSTLKPWIKLKNKNKLIVDKYKQFIVKRSCEKLKVDYRSL